MPIRAYPKLTSGGKLRVWVGTLSNTRAPQLEFELNGAPAQPRTVLPLRSVRPDALLRDTGARRAWSGVFEFDNAAPDTAYEVRVRADTEPGMAVVRTRTLPTALPTDGESWFNVLLVSCFYAKGEHGKHLRSTLSALPAAYAPRFSILAGDQVYLDLPTFEDYDDDAPWLAERFERAYAEGWFGDHYGPVLARAPSICIPDDHEYWNNYPHVSPFIANTFSKNGRERWAAAARAAYAGFQLGPPDGMGAGFELDLHPLSFFFVDTRTFRREDRARSLHPSALAQLEQWAKRVRDQRLYGVFVTGQSVFEAAAGELAGSAGDRALANYGDYAAITQCLRQVSERGRAVVCVTGDVHFGRVVYATEWSTGTPRAFEVICSPSSLVASPWDFYGRIVHHEADFPRHPDGVEPPYAIGAGAERWRCRTIHQQKGDQVAVLSFRRFAGTVQLRVSYWPIHARESVRRPTVLSPFSLRTPE